jgi:hypothetical protein
MKKNLVIVLLLFCSVAYSQAPDFFKYQAIVRTSSGLLVASQTISVKVGILKSTTTGTVVYSENHSVQSNASGSINLDIGRGTNTVGSFNTIAWGNDSYFVKVEMDVNNDNTFEHVGQLNYYQCPMRCMQINLVTRNGKPVITPLIFFIPMVELELERTLLRKLCISTEIFAGIKMEHFASLRLTVS